ncbi:hypothetical protein [Microbacterium oleivorans]|uniref:Uncharacterized protein n=1 Tax=Microbacterium oleivorans TaxID=273677 RepID=A0A4R5YFD1_9MICO|nr:hypothetical protein [Microbacterium oleivorans]TDL43851.1 hypothetical protein E2R54_11720 [Microbacterium oleivorans]
MTDNTERDALARAIQRDVWDAEKRTPEFGPQKVADRALAWMRENGYEKREPDAHREAVMYADDIPEGTDYLPGTTTPIPEDYERHYCEEDGEDWPCAAVREREPVVVDDAIRILTETLDKTEVRPEHLYEAVHRLVAGITDALAALTPDGQEAGR